MFPSATSVDPDDVINNDVIVMGPNDVIDDVIVTSKFDDVSSSTLKKVLLPRVADGWPRPLVVTSQMPSL